MIRPVTPHDAAAIAALYNHYVLHTTASFEEEAVPVEAMRRRIEETAARWPYLVWEEQGRVKGYCYAHPWKERPAYRHTLETTVYLDPACTGRGIGTRLMHALIGECRGRGAHALVACITAGNEPSCRLHRRLGFRQVSEFHEVGFKHGQWLGVVDYELSPL